MEPMRIITQMCTGRRSNTAVMTGSCLVVLSLEFVRLMENGVNYRNVWVGIILAVDCIKLCFNL